MILWRYLFAIVGLAWFLTACAPSHDVEPLWQFETKKKHKQWAAVDAQRFYLCADDVYCLDIATGRLLWELGTFGTHSSAPVIAGERLFFQCGGLYALDAATGAVLWEFWTKIWATVSPAVDTGRVYAPVGEQLYCLDAASGKLLWTAHTGSLEKAPLVNGDRLVICVGGTVQCLDAASGKELWQLDPEQAGVYFVAGGNCIYSSDSEGFVQSYSAATGEVQWRFNTNESLFPPVVVVPNGDALVSAGASLHYFRSGSSVPAWTFKSQEDVMLGVARIIGPHIYVRDARKQLNCLLLDDGSYVGRMILPDGARLLHDGTGGILFPGAQDVKSRTVQCFFVSVR
jgi:outer membrane protein assembly factor BamB